jgi:probable rRNA maturation factor
MPGETGVFFHQEDLNFQLGDEARISAWLQEVIRAEEGHPGEVNVIFCSDPFLLDLNQRYLQHDTLTDIITFPQEGAAVSGDLYISIDRVRDNAATFEVPFDQELSRVMVHGVLHLCGYDDGSPEEKAAMRAQEDHYLAGLAAGYSEGGTH